MMKIYLPLIVRAGLALLVCGAVTACMTHDRQLYRPGAWRKQKPTPAAPQAPAEVLPPKPGAAPVPVSGSLPV